MDLVQSFSEAVLLPLLKTPKQILWISE